MLDVKAACLNLDKPVWKKAKYMADQLDCQLFFLFVICLIFIFKAFEIAGKVFFIIVVIMSVFLNTKAKLH